MRYWIMHKHTTTEDDILNSLYRETNLENCISANDIGTYAG